MTGSDNNNNNTASDLIKAELSDYKALLETLKADADFTYQRFKEIAETRDQLSQSPRIKEQFDRLLKQSKKHVKLLDKELKKLV